MPNQRRRTKMVSKNDRIVLKHEQQYTHLSRKVVGWIIAILGICLEFGLLVKYILLDDYNWFTQLNIIGGVLLSILLIIFISAIIGGAFHE